VKSIAECDTRGKLWEIFCYEWMKIRIRATKNYVEPKSGGHMSIAKLLGIMDSELIPSIYESLFSAPFCPTTTESVQLIAIVTSNCIPMRDCQWDYCIRAVPPYHRTPSRRRILGLMLEGFCGYGRTG
jgi:hypothetical protein